MAVTGRNPHAGPSFSTSSPLTAAHLIPGTVVPPSTHITGRIKVVWGIVTTPDSPTPRVCFTIRQVLSVPAGQQENDYVVPNEKEQQRKYNITLALHHPLWSAQSTPGAPDDSDRNTIADQMEEDRRWINHCFENGKDITLNLEGMQVIKVHPGRVYEVELKGVGERTVRYDGKRLRKIISARPSGGDTAASGPPDWLNSSAPTVSSPAGPSRSSPPTSPRRVPHVTDPRDQPLNRPKAESSRLRPLTSHQLPILSRLPSRTSASSSASDQSSRSGQPPLASSVATRAHPQPLQLVPAKRSVDTAPPGGHPHAKQAKKQRFPESRLEDRLRGITPLPDPASDVIDKEPSEKMTQGVCEQQVETAPPEPSGQGLSVNPQEDDVSSEDPFIQSSPGPSRDVDQGNTMEQSSMGATQPTTAAREPVAAFSPALNAGPIEALNTASGRPAAPLGRASSSPSAHTSSGLTARRLDHVQSVSAGSVVDPPREVDARMAKRRLAEAQARIEALTRQAEEASANQSKAKDEERLLRPLRVSGLVYVPLSDVRPDTKTNIVGVVVSRQEIRKSSLDHTLSIVIADPTRHACGVRDPNADEELVVTMFRRTPAQLPGDLQIGDVVLFRRAKITVWNGKTKAQCYREPGNTWVVMKNGTEIKIQNKDDLEPAIVKAEVDRMKALHQWYAAKQSGRAVQTPAGYGMVRTGSGPGSERVTLGGIPRDQVTLGQVAPGDFFDATFKIMYVHVNPNRRPALELYVTDGTRTSYSNRNFHGVSFPDLPGDALFTLAIHDPPTEAEQPLYQFGHVLRISNVRAKLWKGELELAWSEKPTTDQHAMGWRKKRCQLVPPDSDAARVIDRRLKALKRGEEASEPNPDAYGADQDDGSHAQLAGGSGPSRTSFSRTASAQMAAHAQHAPPSRPVQTSKDIGTIHNDLTSHPFSTVAEIVSNQTVPNRYRVQARIKSIHPRGLPNNDTLIQPYCSHCRAAFKGAWCMSCNDTEGSEAGWRYRFVAILQDGDGQPGDEMAVIVADDEADAFLPPLPPYAVTSNPNDIRKLERRRTEISGEVIRLMQGAKFDGVREKPVIDMTVEVYEVADPRKRGGGVGVEQSTVIAARMFGMTRMGV
ncbi:hypothetical protein IAU60_001232 [Kwoniella sp. DSM 27419]